MQALRDLGSFGDERLKKGGPIFLRRWYGIGRRAFGDWAGIGLGRYGLGGFCTTLW
jgi:hypothetical protein